MKLRQIGSQLESYAPPRYAEEWDNVGWMVGCLDDDLSGILICVDVTSDVIDYAVEHEHNLILAHHPLIFDGFDQLVDRHPDQHLAMEAVRQNRSIYAIHTNADSMPGGLNDIFADVLELYETEPILPSTDEPEAGLGRIGQLSRPLTINELEQRITQQLPVTHMKNLGDDDRTVQTIAVCTGSGGDFVGADLAGQVDLYITGDVGHHTALEARELDLPLIILDHYEMETVFLEFGKSLVREQFGESFDVDTIEQPLPYRHLV